MSQNRKKKKYRFVIGLFILLLPFAQFMPYITPAVLMGDMVASYNIGYGLAGLTITVVLAAFGICMFFGSAISDKLGARKTIIGGLWLMLAGNILCWLAPNIGLFMTGRVIAAAGHGISLTCVAAFYTPWFSGKERTYLVTINGCMSPIAIALSLAISGPIRDMLNSWNGVFLVYSGIILLIALLWTFLAKDHPSIATMAAAGAEQAQGAPVKKQSAIARAVKIKQYWVILVIAALVGFSQTVVTTYLFTYLTEARGLDTTVATTLTSLNSLVGVVGSLIAGALIAQTERRKPFMILFIAMFAVFGFALSLATSNALIIICVVIIGMSFYMIQPAQSNMIIESPEPFDPTILSGAFAMVTGTAQIVNLLVSPFFEAANESFGMNVTFRITFGIVLIPLVLSFFLRETGAHAKKKAATVSK